MVELSVSYSVEGTGNRVVTRVLDLGPNRKVWIICIARGSPDLPRRSGISIDRYRSSNLEIIYLEEVRVLDS